MLALVMLSSCSNDTAETLTELNTPKTTFSVSRADRVQAFAHDVVYKFLMNIEFNADLVSTSSKKQLESDINRYAKEGYISREAFALVLNQDLGIPPSSTNAIFSFAAQNQELIEGLGQKEFEIAMHREFELLQKNPPKKVDGIIAWFFEKAGWGNNPCTGKQIAYTFDVLLDAAGLVASTAGEIPTAGLDTWLTVGAAVALYQDVQDCYDAYVNCN